MLVFFGVFSSSFICISTSAQDAEIEGFSARIEEIEIKGTSELESSQILFMIESQVGDTSKALECSSDGSLPVSKERNWPPIVG